MPSQKQELIENAVGPAPWYWKSFAPVIGTSGHKFVWSYHGDTGELAYLVSLSLANEPDQPRLALNTYCRAFPIEPRLLGIWCPEPRSIRVLCFDPDQLRAFSFVDVVGWFKLSNERVYSATEPIAEFELSSSLAEGTHKIEVPPEFRAVDELLLVNSSPVRTRDDPASAIYVVCPRAGLVEVLPQKWFSRSQFDVGKQWIARVARDPNTHRIVGEGVRMGNFELTEDGKDIAEWIE